MPPAITFSLRSGLPGRINSWLVALLFLLPLFAPSPAPAGLGKTPKVAHPIVTPHLYTKQLRCVNCGMKLNMWARTRHSFTLSSGECQVCSLHCVAEMARQKQESPRNVKVAVYLEPEIMVAAEQAVYVVGSSAAGTMTAISEIGFTGREAAQGFVAEYGGTIMTFTEALAKATGEL